MKISPAMFFKLALHFFENTLACLLNTSLVTSQFPDSWKLSRVTPIFKEGDQTFKETAAVGIVQILPSNGKHFPRVNGVDSSVEGIDISVPQGSCLGPLLFLIYINDLPQAVWKSNVSMYADDTSLCHQSSDITQLNGVIKNDLAKVEKWLRGNKRSLNLMKTHSLLISTKPKHKTLENQGESLKLKIRNNELEVVQKSKYLTNQIDNTLDWKEHIHTVSSKVSRGIGFLRHAKAFLPEETLKNMCTGILEPTFAIDVLYGGVVA